MNRSGRSEPSGPAMTPHASSGWSRRAWATISATRSARITNTPTAYVARALHPTPAGRLTPRGGSAHLHPALDEPVLNEREPVVDADVRGARVVGRQLFGHVLTHVEGGAE